MEIFGLIYLIAYLIDCVGSILVTLLPVLALPSNAISALVSLSTLVVFVLACVGVLRPRRIFLPLSIFYILLLGFGVVIGIMLALTVGPHVSPQEVGIKTLQQHFPWYTGVHWTLLVVWLALAVWGLTARLANKQTRELRPEDGRQDLQS